MTIYSICMGTGLYFTAFFRIIPVAQRTTPVHVTPTDGSHHTPYQTPYLLPLGNNQFPDNWKSVIWENSMLVSER